MAASAGALPVHRLHDEEIERLLATGERRAELDRAVRRAGLSRTERARAARRDEARAAGPRVYVLPGLMGSRIGSRGVLLDDVLWVDLVEIAAGHLTRLALPGGSRLVALGAMLLNTLKLKLSLRIAGFDAHLHPYDWRRSVSDLAAELNARIDAEVAARRSAARRPQHGRRRRARRAGAARSGRIARVVQLGAPNHGSFAPVLALRGVYPTVRKLAALDRRHRAEDLARIVFRTLPALHELLPDPRLAGGAEPVRRRTRGRRCAAPGRDAARGRRGRAGRVAATRRALPAHRGRAPGHRQVGVTLRGTEFEFAVAAPGDGTVPLALAVRPGEPAWYVGEKHGGLPNNGRVIAAVVDLLRKGATQRLPQTASRAHGATRVRSSRSGAATRGAAQGALAAPVARRAPTPARAGGFARVSRRGRARGTRARVRGERGAGGRDRPGAASRARAAAGARQHRRRQRARASCSACSATSIPSGPGGGRRRALGGAIREFTLRRMFAGAARPGVRDAGRAQRPARGTRAVRGARRVRRFRRRGARVRRGERRPHVRTHARGGLRDGAVRRRVGRAGGDGGRAAVQGLPRRTATRGSGPRAATDHGLRGGPRASTRRS